MVSANIESTQRSVRQSQTMKLGVRFIGNTSYLIRAQKILCIVKNMHIKIKNDLMQKLLKQKIRPLEAYIHIHNIHY